MEITFRFNETDRAAFTINVPSGVVASQSTLTLLAYLYHLRMAD
ncbi:BnaA01g25480D [Brassica napus]|uniref:BnaA01g25480D protein n=1 Tax=Brassica napus TaxID=3708 RepID=A0A078HKD9_BRANA|nr:BnaA01g25480D [Brassica napus]